MKSPTRLFFIIIFALLVSHPDLQGQTEATVTILHNFTESGTDGALPFVNLIQGSDGNFYGTTVLGGSNDAGTVYKISPVGAYTTLHSFTASGTNGDAPQASGLAHGSDGNFYGVTFFGGSSNNGTVFRITPAGVLTTLHTFMRTSTDGANPLASLILGSDGNFYGTTQQGGRNNVGTIFRVTPGGTLTTFYNFTGGDTNGANPAASLVQGSDGNFYGTTFSGGSSDFGTVFKITPAGVLTTLHIFTMTGPDGANPVAGLIQGSDGSFYGTTLQGGSNDFDGTVFQITPMGAFT